MTPASDDPTTPAPGAPRAARSGDADVPEDTQLIDHVDKHNEQIETLPRVEVHRRGLRHRSVHIAIFDDAGRIFLHRRSPNKKVLPQHWDISAAGHCDARETYLDAAQREVGEELAIEPTLHPLWVTDASEETGMEFAALWWGGIDDPDSILPSREEIDVYGWFTADEVTRHLSDHERPITPNLLHHLASLLRADELIPPVATWTSKERARMLEAVTTHPSYPGELPRHDPSLGLIIAAEHLPVAAASRELERREGVMPAVQRLLARMIFLGLAAALAAGLLLWPLDLFSERSQERMREWVHEVETRPSSDPANILEKLGAFIARRELFFYFQPVVEALVLKEVAIGTMALVLLPLLIALLLLRQPSPIFKRPLVIAAAAFVTYAGLTVWGRAPRGYIYLSSMTFASMLLFGVIIVAAATALDTARMQARMLRWTGLIVGIVAICSLLQHFDFLDFMPRMDSPRNRMASTIGHNNGVAAVLVYAWFPALAGLFLSVRRLSRWLLIAAVLAMAFVFLALQTRAVWVILLLLTPPFILIAMKLTGRRIKILDITVAVAIVLSFGLIQSIGDESNPMRGNVRFVDRLNDLSLYKLQHSTQWRIVTYASHYMMSDPGRFGFGTGLGTFPPEYSKMAESYQTNHNLDVDLFIPSNRRTMRAHSDVLQVFIELGAVGLLLLFALLFATIRDVEQSYNSLPDTFAKLHGLAILFPITATALHGIVEFPFHVAPTSIAFCIFAGMAFSLRRAWGGRPDESRPEYLNARSLPAPPLHPNVLQRQLMREDATGTLARIGMLVGVLAIAVASAHYASRLQSQASSNFWRKRTEFYLAEYGEKSLGRDLHLGRGILDNAISSVKLAVQSDPANPENSLYLAYVRQSYGDWYRRLAREADAEGRPQEEVDGYRDIAVTNLNAAIDSFVLARNGGADFYRTRYQEGIAHFLLAQLTTGAVQGAHLNAQIQRLTEAVRMNPAFDEAVIMMLSILETTPRQYQDTQRQLRRLLARYHQHKYNERYIEPLNEALKWGTLAEAQARLQVIREDAPDDLGWKFTSVLILAQYDRLNLARLELDQLSSRHPNYPLLPDIRMILELCAENWSEALIYARESLANPGHGEDPELVQAVEAFVAEKLGLPESVELINDFNADAFGSWGPAGEHRKAAMAVLHLYLNDTARAIPYIEAQVRDPSPPDDRFFLVYLNYLESLRRLAEAVPPSDNIDAEPRAELFEEPGVLLTAERWRALPSKKKDPAWLTNEMRDIVTRGLSYQPDSAALQAFARRVFGADKEGYGKIAETARFMRDMRIYLEHQTNAFGSDQPMNR